MKSLFNRVYYGWVMIAVLTVANFTQVGEFNPVLAVFIKPFGDDFGWNRAEVSLGITIGSFCGGLIGPFMGPIIDRQGSRLVLVACQIIYGICLLSLTFLQGSLLHFLLAYSIGRMVIQGGTALATQAAISNWFIRLRGRAMGISTLGTRIGQAILPAAAAFITGSIGWRYAWLFLGATVWIVAIVPSILFIRRRPEEHGLLPDGERVQKENPEDASVPHTTSPRQPTVPLQPEVNWTLKEAVKTRSLWFLTLASAQSYFIGAGINLHLFPYLTDVGLPLPEAVFASSAFFTVAGAGAIFWGALIDRFPLQFCMATAFVVSGVGIVILIFAHTLPLALLFAVVYGISFGGIFTMTQTMWASYYGRMNVGTISGAVLPIQLLTNAIGPFFGGWMYDHNGTYTVAFSIYAVLAFGSSIWALLAGAPPRKSQVMIVR